MLSLIQYLITPFEDCRRHRDYILSPYEFDSYSDLKLSINLSSKMEVDRWCISPACRRSNIKFLGFEVGMTSTKNMYFHSFLCCEVLWLLFPELLKSKEAINTGKKLFKIPMLAQFYTESSVIPGWDTFSVPSRFLPSSRMIWRTWGMYPFGHNYNILRWTCTRNLPSNHVFPEDFHNLDQEHRNILFHIFA